MKRLVYIFIAAALFSCGLIDKLLTFKIEDSFTFNIPPAAIVGAAIPFLAEDGMPTEIEQDLDNNDTRKDLVKSIKLSEVKAMVESPANQTFSPLNEIEIFISTDNQPELLLAWKYDIPSNVGREIELETTDELLDLYIKEDVVNVKVKSKVDETTTTNTSIKVDFTYQVTADPF